MIRPLIISDVWVVDANEIQSIYATQPYGDTKWHVRIEFKNGQNSTTTRVTEEVARKEAKRLISEWLTALGFSEEQKKDGLYR